MNNLPSLEEYMSFVDTFSELFEMSFDQAFSFLHNIDYEGMTLNDSLRIHMERNENSFIQQYPDSQFTENTKFCSYCPSYFDVHETIQPCSLHTICNTCIIEYLKTSIIFHKKTNILCPKCSLIIPLSDIKNILNYSHHNIYDKHIENCLTYFARHHTIYK